jgi:hypothetical protein
VGRPLSPAPWPATTGSASGLGEARRPGVFHMRHGRSMLAADATVALLFDRLPTLHDFDCFRDVNLGDLARILRESTVVNTESLNTEQEVRFALKKLPGRGVSQALFVSSPTHVPRCLRDACVVASEVGWRGSLMAVPCATSWTEEAPVVVEPPHRPEITVSSSSGRQQKQPAFYHLMRRASLLAYFSARSRGTLGDEDVGRGQQEEEGVGEAGHNADEVQTRSARFLGALDRLIVSFESSTVLTDSQTLSTPT